MGLNNCKESSSGCVESVVCHESQIEENGMKVFDMQGVDGGKVLLVKQEGKISALGPKCSHYGAPLHTGALGKGRIRCPWHGACFNINTGDIEDFPGLDSIPCYRVEVQKDGMVKVKALRAQLESNKRMKSMVERDYSNENTFIIIGAGAAGVVCAETLRQEGFTGRLVMISAEDCLPYDRVKLSKMLDAQHSLIALRHEDFYKEHDIEIMLNTQVTSVDPCEKTVVLHDSSTISYDALFVATGNRPKKPSSLGVDDMGNVFTLRSLRDANTIYNALTPDSNVVICGTSFIGMEVASFCNGKVKSVTVIGRSSVPFKESLGLQFGGRIAKLFADKGICLKLGTTISSVEAGNDGKVCKVILEDLSELPVNVLILGIGSEPATDFLPEELTNIRGVIPVNEYMETSKAGVWAGGDIVEASVLGRPAVIGHYGLAEYHGRIAALNMLGMKTPLTAVPFFWTVLFGTSIRFTGRNDESNNEHIVGDIEQLKCAVYYLKDEEVVAVATVGSDPVAAQFAELLAAGKCLSKTHLEEHPNDWWKHF